MSIIRQVAFFGSSLESNFQLAGTDAMLAQTSREKILRPLLSAARVADDFFVDQNHYIEILSKTGEPEKDGRFFWIFHSLDYEMWSKHELDVLVFRGSPILECAASHIVRTLQDSEANNLLLYFFYSSAKSSNSTIWRNLVAACTILNQVLDSCPSSQQQYLLESFLTKTLATLDDWELTKVGADDPKESFKKLLHISTLKSLWDALEQIISEAELHSRSIDLETSRRSRRKLTFILDLDNQTVETGRELMDIIRPMMATLRREYSTVRLLVTNPPSTGDLGLQKPSELLLDYDTERQGLYGPQMSAFYSMINPDYLT